MPGAVADYDVLFVTRKFPPSVGGMENLSLEYARSLDAVAHPKLITLGRSQRNLPWFLPLAAVRTFLALGRIPTLFVGDALMFIALWPVAMLRRRTRVVVNVCGLDLTYPNACYRMVVRRALRRADVVIAISRATADEARELGVDDARLAIIHPGLPDHAVDEAARAEFRRRLVDAARVDDDDVVLTTLGRLVPRKGQAWFAGSVLPLLPPRYRYIVAGSGPEHDAIVAAARHAGVGERCVLLGEVDDTLREAVLVGADVFVAPNIDVPGDMEGFGIVAAEAAMRGTPIVATGIEGLRDAVVDGDLAVLCPQADAPAFAAAIIRMIDRAFSRQDRATAGAEATARFGSARFRREVGEVINGPSSILLRPVTDANT